jgi:Glycosyltransferase family 87
MLRRRWPYLVPPLLFVVLYALQPSDRLVLPQEKPVPGYPLYGTATRLIGDDSDTAAYVMRAKNAARGRKAGLLGPVTFDPDTGWRAYWGTKDPVTRIAPYEPAPEFEQVDFDRKLLVPAEPTDRYFLEYPPAALYLFRLGLIGSGRSDSLDVHPGLLDAHQLNVAWHTPATDDEKALYRTFRHAIRVYWFLMLLALVGLMVLVDRGVGANGAASGPVWLLLLPGFLYFTPCRFDILPAGLVVCAIAAADRRRVLLSGGCLGLAVALKMYPLALAPILLRYAARTWGQATAWCVAAAVPLVLSYGVMYWTDGIDGATVPMKFQLGRDPEPDWCFYGKFLPLEWTYKGTANTLFRTLPVLACVLLMCVRRPPNVESLLRRCTIAVVLFVTFQQFFSPQWWQWFAVLLVPLARQHRWLVWYVVIHDLLTYLHFPILFDSLGTKVVQEWSEWWTARLGVTVELDALIRAAHVWLRAILWAGLVAAFGWREVTSPASAPPVANPSPPRPASSSLSP